MATAEQKRLIVALDVDTAERAWNLVSTLRDTVGMFKVGMQLFTAAGPGIVRRIVDSGERVFLDLKYHDIPNTVAGAGIEATRLGVSMFNIHAAGGREMMQRTADAVVECATSEGRQRPSILAVTILTSANAMTIAEVGYTGEPADLVPRLALLAKASGMDGVVASPNEVVMVRAAVKQDDFVIVTPGARPSGASHFDQKRVATPAEAIAAGADYVVVGRPIIEAADPAQAAQRIAAELMNVAASSVSS